MGECDKKITFLKLKYELTNSPPYAPGDSSPSGPGVWPKPGQDKKLLTSNYKEIHERAKQNYLSRYNDVYKSCEEESDNCETCMDKYEYFKNLRESLSMKDWSEVMYASTEGTILGQRIG